MKPKNRLKDLFEQLLDNTISEQDLKEFLELLNDTEEGQEVRDLMAKHWEKIKLRIPLEFDDNLSRQRFSQILERTGLRKIQSDRKDVQRADKVMHGIRRWVAAASVMILVSVGLYWIYTQNISNDAQQEPQNITLFTGKQAVTLPDGSLVILNEGSELSYGEGFGESKREILFSGEGYFDIQPDAERPFLVHTGEVTTTVLGTAFNLMAYEDQLEISVTVERGEVAVGDRHQIFDKIRPSEQITVDRETRHFEKEMADLSKVLAWKESFMIFSESTIEQVADMIGARYHVEIEIENEDLKKCTMNASFMHGETLEQVLRVVCGVLQAEFDIKENKVEIIGGRKCE